MNTNTTERRSISPIPAGSVQKPVATHRYGDWIMLTLSGDSSRKLREFTINTVIPTLEENCPSLGRDALRATEADQLHLTIAMPLLPMNQDAAEKLLRQVAAINDAINHQINLKGNYNLRASSSTYGNGVLIGIEGNEQVARLAEAVRNYAQDNHYVDQDVNSNGKLSNFFPHITVAKVDSMENARILNDRQRHNSTDRKLHKLIAAASPDRMIDLVFDRVEIKRIDSKEGQKTIKLLASMNLAEWDWQFYPSNFIECSHVQKVAPKRLPAPTKEVAKSEKQQKKQVNDPIADFFRSFDDKKVAPEHLLVPSAVAAKSEKQQKKQVLRDSARTTRQLRSLSEDYKSWNLLPLDHDDAYDYYACRDCDSILMERD